MPIVRGFFGHGDIVRVAFAAARIAHPDKFPVTAQFGNTGSSAVPQGCLQSAAELGHDLLDRARVGYDALDPLRYQFLFVDVMLTVALCFVCRANKLVGLPFVWLTNPLTLIPVYGPNLLVGRWLLGKPMGDFSQLYKALEVDGSLIEKGQEFFHAIWPIFLELWIGSLVVGALLGVGSYFTFYQLTVAYRRRHAARLAKKHPAPGP